VIDKEFTLSIIQMQINERFQQLFALAVVNGIMFSLPLSVDNSSAVVGACRCLVSDQQL
jgi:hypothetical protein